MADEGQLQLHLEEEQGDVKKSWSNESLASFPMGKGKDCVCSPTAHAGSFRCRQHRQQSNLGSASPSRRSPSHKTSNPPSPTLLAEAKMDWWIAGDHIVVAFFMLSSRVFFRGWFGYIYVIWFPMCIFSLNFSFWCVVVRHYQCTIAKENFVVCCTRQEITPTQDKKEKMGKKHSIC